jgi:glucose-1-phosphate adenylyltransferase
MVMGADYYESLEIRKIQTQQGEIPIGIGEFSTIRRAIVDKNARIGRNVTIVNKEKVEESNCENEGFYIRNGIVVVLKNASIPDGKVI